MNNQIMFGIGLLIFAIYLYFLLSIIWKQKRTQERRNVLNPDSNDFDGIGNQGRIPNKKPKNRA